MNRRYAVPAVVSFVIIGTLIIGVAAIGSQPSEASVSIQGGPEDAVWTGSSPSGQVESIPWTVSDVTVTWDGLGAPAEEVRFGVYVDHGPDRPELMEMQNATDASGTSGEWTPNPVSGDLKNLHEGDNFEPDGDGETWNQTLSIYVEATVIDENGNEAQQASDFLVKVSITDEVDETTEDSDVSHSRSVDGEVVMADSEE